MPWSGRRARLGLRVGRGLGGRAVVRGYLYRGSGYVLAAVFIGILASHLGRPFPIALAAPQLPGTAIDQLQGAADTIDVALSKGGSGLTFEAVQRNTLHMKAGGPQIAVRTQDDPTKVVAMVDDFYVNAMVSRGAVTPDSFWMFMRRGPAEGQPADFDRSEPIFSVIQREGVMWRNDGRGWYATDASPGMGMDPVTARQLPQLLRSLPSAEVLPPTLFDGRLLVGIRGTAKPNDYPGVIASDGRDFTDSAIDVTFWLDDDGRLCRLEAHARNLNQTTWDLISEVVVTFAYGGTGDPPDPSPALATEPGPTSVQVPS